MERLIYRCGSLKEAVLLNHMMEHEFACYPYPSEIADSINTALENHLFELKALARQNNLLPHPKTEVGFYEPIR